MKKHLFYTLSLTISLIISLAAVSANPIDTAGAKAVAQTFYSSVTGQLPTKGATSGIACQAMLAENGLRSTRATDAGTACFYVVNMDDGFVIVSADDRVTPILGYSTSSRFDYDNVPENMALFLEGYRQEIAYCINNSEPASTETSRNWQRLLNQESLPATRASVSPLLQTTWSQDPYYNNYCPVDAANTYSGHAVTGCVATAMAQIIRYWQWPTAGFNSHSYTCDYGTLSVNYGAATYNYSNMPNALSSSSSSTQINEVAKLMYHCGVAVNMDYGADESGAYSIDVPSALRNYFAYANPGTYVEKASYSASNWTTLIKNELNNARPVYYSGSGSAGGHAFVFDGYDNNGYFHINWGWGGNCDGYFSVSSLSPTSNYDFSQYQAAIIGISASEAFMSCSSETMVFTASVGSESSAQTLVVRGHSLGSNITITVGNGFKVSTNGSSFSTSATLAAAGGTLYVKFAPSSTGNVSRTMTLTSGSATASVSLSGNVIEASCLPPKNLTGTYTGSAVNLSWNVPVTYSSGSPASAVLSWDNTVSDYCSSYGDDVSYCMLHRFTTSDLSAYNQYQLTQVSFVASYYADSYRVVVYKGGSYSNDVFTPGEMVYNQIVPTSSLNTHSWNTVTLGNPVMVDATQELWYGVLAYSSGNKGGSYAIRYGTNALVNGKGNVLGLVDGNTDGTGGFEWWIAFDGGNFPIKGVVEKVSTNGIRYNVYRQGSLIGYTTSTSYTDSNPLSSSCTYTVSAVWGNGCSEDATVTTLSTPAQSATVILEAHDVWGDGSGYQLLLDADAIAFGTIIPETVPLTGAGDVSAATYAEFEYKIPTNADGALTTTHIVFDGADTITIPAGTYDFCVTNPTPGDRMWIAGNGRYDNFVFNSGCTYHFTVAMDGNGDAVTIDIIPNSTSSFTCGTSTLTDRDGNTYNTVQIGSQCWMKENLRTKKYADGTSISQGSETSTTTAYWYYPNNNSSNFSTYGLLYNWKAVMHGSAPSSANPSGVQGICPTGWHVPSDVEWKQLTDYVSSQSQYVCGSDNTYIAKALASTTGWNSSTNTCAVGNTPSNNNATCFGALPAGFYYSSDYDYSGRYAYFWSATESSSSFAYSRSLDYGYAPVYRVNDTKSRGYSVRCLRDEGSSSQTVPTVTTNTVSDIAATSVTCGGNVTSDGGATVTARGVCWSTSQNPTVSGSHTTNGSGTGSFTSSLTGLTPNTTYYVRAYAMNSVGTAYGAQKTFTTSTTSGPSVDYALLGFTTDGSSIVNEITLSMNEDFNPAIVIKNNGPDVPAATDTIFIDLTFEGRELGFMYMMGSAIDQLTTGLQAPLGSQTPLFTAAQMNQYGIEGTFHMCYTVRIVGVAIDPVASNNTACITVNRGSSAQLPTVTTNTVYNIASTSATCGGNVTSDGGATVTARGVCWSTSQNPTVSNSHTTNGSGTGAFTSSITGLTSNTTYYVRAYATNSAGTAYGTQMSFTTATSIPSGDAQPCPGTPTLTDIDGNTYNTVQIGGQCWMRENLRTTKYADGISISQNGYRSDTTGYWYYPNNDASYKQTYGLLYNWPAVMHGATSSDATPSGIQGICPTGWHVPSYAEWTQLTDYVSSQSSYVCGSNNSNIAKALAATTGWSSSTSTCAVGNTPSNNNATGFSALPAGLYDGYNSYIDLAHDAMFWSSTGTITFTSAYFLSIASTSANISNWSLIKDRGLSVRCLRNEDQSQYFPTVTTRSVSNLTSFTATCGGNVTSTNGVAVTARGVCWSINPNPTVNDNHTTDGSGTGSYTSNLTGLSSNFTYYIRAYATNQYGTVYGGEVRFTTPVSSNGDAFSCPGTATLTDRDGNVYNTVQIGGQCWMRENLRTTKYADGTDIAESTDIYHTPYYYPDNNTDNKQSYGLLYQWDVVMRGESSSDATPSGVQGICPNGWHVPSNAEWIQLTDYLSSQSQYWCNNNSTYLATALSSKEGWDHHYSTSSCRPGIASSNATGFNALPAGIGTNFYYYDYSNFSYLGTKTYFWSATAHTGSYYYARYLDKDSSRFVSKSLSRYQAYSIRCLRDESQSQYFPTVTTNNVTNIASSTATCGGNITASNGVTVTARGICWSTLPNPSLSDAHTTNGSGTGAFTSSITGFSPGITYYVRAYATTPYGTVYGNRVNFILPLNPNGDEFSCSGTPTLTDRDGNVYNTVQIGDQCWMRENLRTKKYADGTDIVQKSITDETNIASWFYPNGDASTMTTYGLLYNWRAVMHNAAPSSSSPSNVQGICPNGWHIPSNAEWSQLTDYVSSQSQYWCDNNSNYIAKALASTAWPSNPDGDWNCFPGQDSESNNATGFSVLPAGVLRDAHLYYFNESAYFWTTTMNDDVHYEGEYYPSEAYYYRQPSSSGGLSADSECAYTMWLSVRCIRNEGLSQNLPVVVTSDITGNTPHTINGGGNVLSNGGSTIIGRGVCWSTSQNPTIADSHTSDGTGTGLFSSSLTGLEAGTFYYVRAYATNSAGTGYGDVVLCSTPGEYESQPCPGFETVTDRDNNVYNTVQIGRQCWMRENLKTTKYADGTAIEQGNTLSDTIGYWIYPDNDASNKATYGLLYNWKATMGNAQASNENPSGVQGICPTGWHVPSSAEWDQLTDYVSNQSQYWCSEYPHYISKSLAGTIGWDEDEYDYNYDGICSPSYNPSSNNATGFNMLPAGYGYIYDGYYEGAFGYGFLWSSTYYEETAPWCLLIMGSTVSKMVMGSSLYLSVRCLRDEGTTSSVPTVSTSTVSNIAATSATCGGNVTSNGGANVTARGVCWSTSQNPTIADSHTTNGSGTGSFTSSITNLAPNTTYYVRAYATNSVGTAYGEQRSFTTGCNTVTVSISGTTAISYGGNTTLTASGANSYRWSTGATTAAITVGPTATTTYTVTGTNAYGCTGTTSVTVTVNSIVPTVTTSTVSDIAATSATCGGNVTSNGGANVTARGVCWSTSQNPTVSSSHTTNGTGMGAFSSSLTNLAPNTTYYVRAYATNSVGTAYGTQRSFTTGCNTVTVSISGTTAISYGGNTTLTASGANSYRWSTGATTAAITVSPTATTTYTVTGTNAYGCTGTASITVTVNAIAPTVSTNSVTSIGTTSATCGGNVTSTGGASVTARGVCWSTSQNPTVSNSHTTDGSGTGSFTSNITGLAPNTTYYVRAYAINSAGTAYGTQRTFTTSCNSVTVSISGTNSINYGQSTTLTASGANSYRWSTGATTAAITVSPTATTTYTVTGTNAYGCTGTKSVTVTVNSTVPTVTTNTVSNIAATSATCGGNVTSNGGANVTERGVCWSTSQNPTVSNNHTTDGSGTGAFTTSITGLTPNTTYYVRAYATNSAGTGYGEEVSFTTTCNTVTVSISGTTNINYGGSTTLTASGASSYRWNTDATTAAITVSPTTTTTYTVTGTNAYGCTGTASVTVTVNSTVPTVTTNTVSNIAATSATCGGNVTSDGGATVTARGVCWSTSQNPTIADSHTTDGSGMGSFTTSITGLTPNTTYYVRAYATNSVGTGYGEQRSFTTGCNTVIVSISGTTIINYGQSTTFTASGASSYRWSTGATTASITVSPTATTTYTVTGTNAYGCTGTMSVTVTVATIPAGDAQPCPSVPTVTDIDGNVYNTVKIGNQCWMKENLRTTHYADNTEVTGRYAPNGDANNVSTYGYLYGWDAVMHGAASSNANPSGVQGVCPTGWHMPSNIEWTQLMDYVKSVPAYWCGGSSSNIGKALADTTGFNVSGNDCEVGNDQSANNATGFSAMPAGGCYGGIYFYFGDKASFWSTTENNSSNAYYLYLYSSYASVIRGTPYKANGISVRCVLGEGYNLSAVTTDSVTNVTLSTATCGGNVTSNGGANVTARGVCWSTLQIPTISDSHTTDGSGTGTFTSSITGLAPSTTYFVRAYATNSVGTAYGEEVSFTTLAVPEGDAQPCPGTPTVTDIDGNTYNTVQIGQQCWMKENLRATHYADNTEITARYAPHNDEGNVSTYGYLYEWNTVMHGASSSDANPSGIQGVCPTGWHVPSDAEWRQLTNYVGSQSEYLCGGNSSYIAKALAATTGWNTTGNDCTVGNDLSANNATGFSALPAGYYGGYYGGFGSYAGFWSATEGDGSYAYGRNLYYEGAGVGRGSYSKYYGFSVRCVLGAGTNLPTVTTSSVTDITAASATCGGNVTADGGTEVTARGVCWSTSQNPTVSDSRTTDGTGTGSFTSSITRLTPNTTYYVRAYATNSVGTGYGTEKRFTTPVTPTTDAHSCPGAPTLTDVDGNVYNTVQIGEQCWMRENLRATRYADSTAIPMGSTSSITEPYRYAPSYNESNVPAYGYMYNWVALMRGASSSSANPSGVQGVCPNGWHLPSDAEWLQLINFVNSQNIYGCNGNSENIGKAMSSTTGWNNSSIECAVGNNQSSNNATGFSIVAAGCIRTGYNVQFGRTAYLWSATESNEDAMYGIYFSSDDTLIYNVTDLYKNAALTVRCLKDNGGSTAQDAQPCPGTPTVTDIDGNTYNTVQIGSQCWMKENLRTTHYADQTEIPAGSIPSYTEPYRYAPNSDESNVDTYGYLYNWKAVMRDAPSTNINPSWVQGICPNGWHVPSSAEWKQLTDYLGSQSIYQCGNDNSNIAKALAGTTGWRSDTTTCAVGNNSSDNNTSGFNALPAGYYYGSHYDFGRRANFWSATEYSSINYASYRGLGYNYNSVSYVGKNKTSGCSVRCVYGDGTASELPTIITNSVADITSTSATCGGNVTDDGGGTVYARGICWSTMHDPTIVYEHTTDGDGLGSFTSSLSGLGANTTYYVRAYATNSVGTAYGEEMSFTTESPDWQPCPGTPTLTDVDVNTYNTVQIGNQCWMKENLRTTKYADGTSISQGGEASTTVAYWYYPNNRSSNKPTYGLLYNWKAVMQNSSSSDANPSGVQGICPTGWHVPSYAEWTQLTDYVSSQSQYVCGSNNTNIAKALASTTGWHWGSDTCAVGNTPSSNNATGFSALPAGYYYYGSYYQMGYDAYFWSASESDNSNAYRHYLYYNSANVRSLGSDKNLGYSVRCLRDEGQSLYFPTVTTNNVTNITATSATCGGNVTDDGGAEVTACGVCWSTSQNPTIADSYTVDGTGTGEFTSSITGLTANTTYYVRAYATNEVGTAYGEEVSFTTDMMDIVMGGSFTDITTCDAIIYDNGGANGNYGTGRNDWMTIHPSSGAITIRFMEFDVASTDTLYIYNGTDPNNDSIPLQIGSLSTNWINESNIIQVGDHEVSTIIPNPTGALTLHFVSAANSETRAGFKLKVTCFQPCQRLYANIDLANSTPTPHYDDELNDGYLYVDFCPGDTVHIAAYPTYPDNDFGYHQDISTTYFDWNYGQSGYGQSDLHYVFDGGKGYNLTLSLNEQHNGSTCYGQNSLNIRVRGSKDPFVNSSIPENVCQGTEIPILISNNSVADITLSPISDTVECANRNNVSVDSTVFIPDGPNCTSTIGSQCYSSSVNFTSFPPNATITSAADILGVRLNIEHSYIGDINISLICPNNRSVKLMSDHNDLNNSADFGIPNTNDNGCDASNNPQGTGWNYCWSGNSNYAQIDDACYNNNNVHNSRVDSSIVAVGYPGQPGFVRGQKYYTPDQSFNNLIGCPLNGLWKIQVCDTWSSDNGYVFGWELTLDPNLMPQDWTYDIDIPNITWESNDIIQATDTTATLFTNQVGNHTYNYTLVDEFGCEYSHNILLHIEQQPNLLLSGDTALCAGQSTTLTASGADSYIWSTGETTASITISPTATTTYTVTGTNQYGCTDTASVTVTVNPLPDIPILSMTPNVACHGDANGTIQIVSPVGNGYSYSLNDANFQDTSNIYTRLDAGYYMVTVRTAASCTSEGTIFVESSLALPVVVINPIEEESLCPSQGMQEVTASILGGTAPFTVTWEGAESIMDNSLQATVPFDAAICDSTYIVTVHIEDGYGCEAHDTYSFHVTDTMAPVLTGTIETVRIEGCSNADVMPAATDVDALMSLGLRIADNCSPSEELTVSSRDEVSGSCPIVITRKYVVEDLCGNVSDTMIHIINIQDNVAPTINGTIDDITLVSDNCTFFVPDLTEMLWDLLSDNCTSLEELTLMQSPEVGYLITGDTAVTLTVFDRCDNASTLSVMLRIPEMQQVSINPSDTALCFGEIATLCASGASSYIWSTGDNTAATTVSPTSTTTYTVTGTDQNGCSATASATITLRESPTANISGNLSFCQGESSLLTVTGNGSYLWDGGSTQNSITVSESGVYSVTVTNDIGCSTVANATVTAYALPNVTISGNTVLCQGENTTLIAHGAETYLWTGGLTTPSITVNTFGYYTVTGVDANGCSNSATVSVLFYNLPPVTISGATDICSGESTTLTASGAETYLWNNGNTNATLQTSTNGTYTVIGTDTNGCHGTASATVTIHGEEFTEVYVEADGSYTWHDTTYTESGDYTWAGQTIYGCDSIVILHLTVTTGIASHNDGILRIYPNPTIGTVTLELAPGTCTLKPEIQLFDIYGQRLQVMPVRGETTQIDLSRYATGVYLIKLVNNGNVTAVRKVVKE